MEAFDSKTTTSRSKRFHEIEVIETLEETSKIKEKERFFSYVTRYQFILFLMTQAGYFAVAGSILHTTFFEPSKEACRRLSQYNRSEYSGQNTNSIKASILKNGSKKIESFAVFREEVLSTEFHSLAIEWQEECERDKNHWNITLMAPTLLMSGAIIGSFISGYLADRFGRKPVVIGCLLIICLTNIMFILTSSAASKNYSSSLQVISNNSLGKWWHKIWYYKSTPKMLITFSIMFVCGAACGGYMVTNIVLLIEALHNSSRLRLLVVSLNGWPLGMVFTASLGALTAHWRIYHLCVALSAISVAVLLEVFSMESFHWHSQREDCQLSRKTHRNIQLEYTNGLKNDNSATKLIDEEKRTKQNGAKIAKYSYADFVQYPELLIPLMQLSYCFFSSSVVSYGILLSVDFLPGNRYTNLAIMGIGKFVLGFGSYLVSFQVGRRLILIISLGISCVLSWMILTLQSSSESSSLNFTNSMESKIDSLENKLNILQYFRRIFSVTWLVLALAMALDPSWKINHLFSTELFPLQVRNMSRGLCNVAARFGSLASPLMIYLRSVDESLPFWVYSVLLTFQCIISFTFPETKYRELLREMPLKKEKIEMKSTKTLNFE